MRWCRFQTGQKTTFGIMEGDRITEVEGSPFESYSVTQNKHDLDKVSLLVPVIPPTFYAAGINYPEHVTWAARMRGEEPVLPRKADIGYRASNALIANGENIIKPKDSTTEFQYEGELVAVIGRTAKNLSRDEALSCVLGYTIGNDVSERTWQRGDRTFWRAKNTDTFKPMGPWIETDVDPTNLETTIRLSGRVVSQFNTGTMIFDTATYISEMSRYLTLYPGDVVWMGTDGATENMVPGDVCEIEIEGIGTLSNPVVAEE